jgi:hypothetical protein
MVFTSDSGSRTTTTMVSIPYKKKAFTPLSWQKITNNKGVHIQQKESFHTAVSKILSGSYDVITLQKEGFHIYRSQSTSLFFGVATLQKMASTPIDLKGGSKLWVLLSYKKGYPDHNQLLLQVH